MQLKNKILIGAIVFFSLFSSASAAVTFSIDAGETPVFNSSVSSASELSGVGDETFYCVEIYSYVNSVQYTYVGYAGSYGVNNITSFANMTNFVGSPELLNPQVFPIGDVYGFVYLYASYTGTCDDLDFEVGGLLVAGTEDDQTIIFTVPETFSGFGGGITVFATSGASDLIAGIGTATKAAGGTIWVIAAIAIAIPLAFWVFEKVIELFTLRRKEREKYDDLTDAEYIQFKQSTKEVEEEIAKENASFYAENEAHADRLAKIERDHEKA